MGKHSKEISLSRTEAEGKSCFQVDNYSDFTLDKC